MELKNKRKSAMITVELAVSLVLVMVVLLVTLGLFGNNLENLFASSNFKNVFNGESMKTFFASFNRNYSNSQMDVQLLGEQGLEVIRQKANNSDLKMIDSAVNSSGTLVSNKQASTMIYLSQIINIIVGQGNVCKNMKKESISYCGTSGVPDNQYALIIDGKSLYALNLETQEKTLLSNNFSYIEPGDSSALTYDQKYTVINSLTNSYGNNILASGAIVINSRDEGYTKAGSLLDTNQIENQIIALLNNTKQKYVDAYNICNKDDPCMKKGNCSQEENVTYNQCKKYGDWSNSEATVDRINEVIKELDTLLSNYSSEANNIVSENSGKNISYLQENNENKESNINYYSSSNNWNKNSAGNIVAGSEDALEIAKPVNKILQNYANNSNQNTSSSFATTARALRYAMDGGGGGGSVSSGPSSVNATATSYTNSGVNSNTSTSISGKTIVDTTNTDTAGLIVSNSQYSTSSVTVKCTPADGYICNASANEITTNTEDSNGNKMIFAQSYAESLLSSASGTPNYSDRIAQISNFSSRIKVLEIYNEMMDTTLNYKANFPLAKRNLIYYLKQDNVNTETACSEFTTGMEKISKKYGLTSLNAELVGNSYDCTPNTKKVSSFDKTVNNILHNILGL